MESYELVVIGSGPAGRRAAIQAAKLGRSVLVIENRLRVGGVSVHTGTIPSKTLRETVAEYEVRIPMSYEEYQHLPLNGAYRFLAQY